MGALTKKIGKMGIFIFTADLQLSRHTSKCENRIVCALKKLEILALLLNEFMYLVQNEQNF